MADAIVIKSQEEEEGKKRRSRRSRGRRRRPLRSTAAASRWRPNEASVVKSRTNKHDALCTPLPPHHVFPPSPFKKPFIIKTWPSLPLSATSSLQEKKQTPGALGLFLVVFDSRQPHAGMTVETCRLLAARQAARLSAACTAPLHPGNRGGGARGGGGVRARGRSQSGGVFKVDTDWAILCP